MSEKQVKLARVWVLAFRGLVNGGSLADYVDMSIFLYRTMPILCHAYNIQYLQSDNVAHSDGAFDSNPDPKSSGKKVDKDVSPISSLYSFSVSDIANLSLFFLDPSFSCFFISVRHGKASRCWQCTLYSPISCIHVAPIKRINGAIRSKFRYVKTIRW